MSFNLRSARNRKASDAGRKKHQLVDGSQDGMFLDKPSLDLLARPRRLAQKRKAGLNARVVLEATNGHALRHLSPSMPGDKPFEHFLQRDAVQWIEGMVRR